MKPAQLGRKRVMVGLPHLTIIKALQHHLVDTPTILAFYLKCNTVRSHMRIFSFIKIFLRALNAIVPSFEK